MPTLRTKLRLFCAKHSRAISGVQLAVLTLFIAVCSAALGAFVAYWGLKSQVAIRETQHAAEIRLLQEIGRERLDEKDAIIMNKDAEIARLASQLSETAEATARAAKRAESAASQAGSAANRAGTAATKADTIIQKMTPKPAKPKDPPAWLGGN